MQLSGKLLMHFKPFWMPCLHIIFFTSTPIPELIAVENFTKRWNGILASLEIPAASLVGFQHDRFEQVGLKISLYVTGSRLWQCMGCLQSHEGKPWAPFDSKQEKFLSDVTGIQGSENEEKKCLSDQKSCFTQEPSFQNFVFFCCCSSDFLSDKAFIRNLYVTGFYFFEKFAYRTN